MSGFAISAERRIHCKAPKKFMQLRPGFDEVKRSAGVVDGCLDLSPVPNDARILQKSVDVLLAESRDDVHVEMRECIPEILALAENREPRQSGLKTLQTDLFEQPGVVDNRASPFGVVIFDVLLVITRPPATMPACRCLS